MSRAERRNIALLTAYDGTRYAGWQRQAKEASIQGELERALAKICKHPVTLYGCSRTDAGVHAQGHVSNFFTDCRIPADRLPLALDAHLPADIVCRAAAEVAPQFNARFAAGGKQYSYYIHQGPRPLPQLRRYAYHEARPLDFSAMQGACELLLGEHDFSAFQASGSPSAGGCVRRLYALAVWGLKREGFEPRCLAMDYAPGTGRWDALIRRGEAMEGSPFTCPERAGTLLRVVVHGSGFLYNMMRILAGTLLYVGLGKIGTEQLKEALRTGRRTLAGKTLAAAGLCLDYVDYAPPLFGGLEAIDGH